MDPSFLHLSPDEQRQMLRRERSAVPDEAVLDFLDTWKRATKDYAGSGARIIGSIVGFGDVILDPDGHPQISTQDSDHTTVRPCTPAQVYEVENAIRGGTLQIMLMPSSMMGGQVTDAAVLHQASGKFAEFNYAYQPPSTVFAGARATRAARVERHSNSTPVGTDAPGPRFG